MWSQPAASVEVVSACGVRRETPIRIIDVFINGKHKPEIAICFLIKRQ